MAGKKVLRKWEIDDATVVEAKLGDSRRIFVSVNGSRIPGQLSFLEETTLRFDLPGERYASVTTSRQFGSRPEINLRVDGQLMLETSKTPIRCGACHTVVRPNDRFCDHCGEPLKPASHHKHVQQVRKATNMIWVVAALFVASGVLLFFVERSAVQTALHRLDGLSANMVYPTAVNGVKYTVGELRQRISWEGISPLVINLILAGVMAGLALWSRRAALPAVLAAGATYAVVLVTGALVNPSSIAQGVYLKLIIILALARGAKSAFAIRAAAN